MDITRIFVWVILQSLSLKGSLNFRLGSIVIDTKKLVIIGHAKQELGNLNLFNAKKCRNDTILGYLVRSIAP